MSEGQLFDSALSLPQAQRADLAFQLLQSLEPQGERLSSEALAAELRGRVEAHRQGELKSVSLDEARVQIQRQIAGDT